MPRPDFNNLQVFLVVARERSFTRAAAQLGVSQSALSHTIRTLEAKLGIRLLTRTTRGVAPTEAGAHLLATLTPHFEEIEAEMAALGNHGAPAGTVRITATDHAADTILWPKLSSLMLEYPEINIEIAIDNRMVDIVTNRFDAGVRLGDQVAKDMIAVRIGPDAKLAAIAHPDYFAQRATPKTPQELTLHNCINLRLPTHGGLYAWEFMKDDRTLEVQVRGQFTASTTRQMLNAALAGVGIGFIPQALAAPHVAAGELVPVLEEWWPVFPGYHLYYPSRLQSASAFSIVVDALRLPA
ncbi:DNA-binding transcriptional LysR family regulator [Pseudoduganella lurida]|uniref:DNA-binding transcriptional LysR family regulator n=1 Tax=Pseudoduganella lurida TaxID=1036180 RepID=A0A562R0C9_9BURK|nr:LysR family transcriptional regulator [Pseudoduganella lurida]TWI62528.1 DNA-binding transcriptional LysR family regulator [Pseudoduganella lurida]